MSDSSAETEQLRGGDGEEGPRERVRPGGRSARVRQAIFEAAIDLLVEEGASGIRLPAVAERAGVSKKTVYRWWSTGTELLREALEDLEDRGIDIPNTGAWESDVRGFVRSFAAYLADPRTTAVLRYVTVARSADPQFGDWMDAFWAERGAAFDVIVQRAIARGELAKRKGELPFIVLVAGPIVLQTMIAEHALTSEEIEELASVVSQGMRYITR